MIDPSFFLGYPVPFSNICSVYPPKVKDILNTMKDISICENQITIKSAMNEQNIKDMEKLAEEILK